MSHRTSRSNTAEYSNYSAKKARRILRLRAVMAITGWSRSTVYAKVNAGILPAPAHLGDGKNPVWDEAEIAEIIEQAFAARDQATA